MDLLLLPNLVLADAGLGPLFRNPAVPMLALAILSMLVVVSEAGILLGMKWGTFARSLLVSLLMNVASTLAGILTSILLGFLLPVFSVFLVENPLVESFFFLLADWGIGGLLFFVALFLLLFFTISVLVEAGVLFLIDKQPARQIWRVAIAVNLVSYLILIFATPLVFSVLSSVIPSPPHFPPQN